MTNLLPQFNKLYSECVDTFNSLTKNKEFKLYNHIVHELTFNQFEEDETLVEELNDLGILTDLSTYEHRDSRGKLREGYILSVTNGHINFLDEDTYNTKIITIHELGDIRYIIQLIDELNGLELG